MRPTLHPDAPVCGHATKHRGAFALVLLELNTAAMQLFPDRFAATLPPAEHAMMVTDQAGWHGLDDLKVPGNMVLTLLPSYSPALNSVERV